MMSSSGSSSTLKVLVRVRPPPTSGKVKSEREIQNRCVSVQGSSGDDGEGKAVSVTRGERKGTSDFNFSEGAVLGPSAPQPSVYNHCKVVGDVVDGVDCCIMAYGQTSSGKTYSMYGVKVGMTQSSSPRVWTRIRTRCLILGLA